MVLRFSRTFVTCAVAVTALASSVQEIAAQAVKAKPPKIRASRGGILYEDDEIKLRIPRPWRMLSTAEKAAGILLLEKNHYTLRLEYHTVQASGIIGGRFLEIFNIPWLTADDAWTCSEGLTQDPWPASRQLMFVNLIVDTGDAKVRENCGVPKPLGTWMAKDGSREYVGNRRWFGDYFTTRAGFYFFADGDNDHDCGSKAYMLTSQATSLDQLPIAVVAAQNHNPDYKRCSPF